MLTGYAAYDGPTLQRIALVNFKLWPAQNTSAGYNTARDSAAVALDNLPTGTSSVRVRRLTSTRGGYADQAEQIEYDHTQWTAQSDGTGVSSNATSETIKVVAGKVVVDVKDSEAVLLVLE